MTDLIIHCPGGPGQRLRGWLYRILLKDHLGKKQDIGWGTRIYNHHNLKIGSQFRTGHLVNVIPGGCHGVLIGDNVSLAHGVYLRSANHQYSDTETPIREQEHSATQVKAESGETASIVIEDDVWIGAYAMILSGAKIGKGSVISANSVVSTEIPPYSIVSAPPSQIVANRQQLYSQTKHKVTKTTETLS